MYFMVFLLEAQNYQGREQSCEPLSVPYGEKSGASTYKEDALNGKGWNTITGDFILTVKSPLLTLLSFQVICTFCNIHRILQWVIVFADTWGFHTEKDGS